MNVFQIDHKFVTVHLKGLKCFSFSVGDAIDNSDTDQASPTENDNEAVERMKQHVPGQDSVSDGADNTLNTPVDDVEDAKQTHPHHEEDISDDDGISDPDYTASFDESFEGVIKDHPETQGEQSQTQKYLVAAHTKMECDSMRGTIEHKIVTDNLTPRDYVIILQTARIRPSP